MSSGRTDEVRPTRKQRREQAREERRAKEAEERHAASARRRRKLVAGAMLVLLVATAVAWLRANTGEAPTSARAAQPQLKLAPLGSLGVLRAPGPAGPLGPEEVPIPAASAVAGIAAKAEGEAVDGIECSTEEQTLFHIHAHLTIFVDGAAKRVPYAIGIPGDRVERTPRGTFVGSGRCFYWLHTHAADGIVHIESPVERTYTLGEFFDIWGQPLGRKQVGPWTGPVTAIYNGMSVTGDPREIPLTAHAQIQLDVGRPLVAPEAITFPEGL
jgi:hypothetical protein